MKFNNMMGDQLAGGNQQQAMYGGHPVGAFNPLFIDAMRVLSPRRGEQLAASALEAREQQKSNLLQQEHQMKQMDFLKKQQLEKAMMQGLSDVDFSDPNKALQQLQAKGLSADQALPLIGKFQDFSNNKEQLDISRGNLGVAQQGLGLRAQEIAEKREERNAKPKMSAQEQIMNNKVLAEGRSEAKTAEETLIGLKSLESAFEKFDKASGKRTKAGSILHGDLAKSIGSEYLLSPEQRSASQIIGKTKAELAKKMFSSGLGAALGYRAEAELMKALPDEKLLPEARNDIVSQMAKGETKKVLKNAFNNTWKELNHGDMQGADIIFNEILSSVNFFDEKGFPKKDAVKYIDSILREYASKQEVGNE